jgi:hypothetical protein
MAVDCRNLCGIFILIPWKTSGKLLEFYNLLVVRTLLKGNQVFASSKVGVDLSTWARNNGYILCMSIHQPKNPQTSSRT